MNPLHIDRPHGVFHPANLGAGLLFWLALGAAIYFAVRS